MLLYKIDFQLLNVERKGPRELQVDGLPHKLEIK